MFATVVGDGAVVGRHRGPRELFPIRHEEMPRDFGEVEQVSRSKRSGRDRTLKAGQPILDVVCEPGFADLAVADDVDPGRHLFLNDLTHRRPHPIAYFGLEN